MDLNAKLKEIQNKDVLMHDMSRWNFQKTKKPIFFKSVNDASKHLLEKLDI